MENMSGQSEDASDVPPNQVISRWLRKPFKKDLFLFKYHKEASIMGLILFVYKRAPQDD